MTWTESESRFHETRINLIPGATSKQPLSRCMFMFMLSGQVSLRRPGIGACRRPPSWLPDTSEHMSGLTESTSNKPDTASSNKPGVSLRSYSCLTPSRCSGANRQLAGADGAAHCKVTGLKWRQTAALQMTTTGLCQGWCMMPPEHLHLLMFRVVWRRWRSCRVLTRNFHLTFKHCSK